VSAVARDLLKPKPNARLLWMRPAVARNNMLSEKAKARKFWKKKVAEPVLLSQVDVRGLSLAIQDRMFHHGYFSATVTGDTVWTSRRKARIIYGITLGEPYRIASVTFPAGPDTLSRQIREASSESVLRPGDIYTLETVKDERARIDRDLKEHGFIHFSPDFMLLRADTVSGTHQVRIAVTVKPETPPESRTPYAIRHVVIHDDNLLDTSAVDTLQFDGYSLVSRTHSLRFEPLHRGIFLKPGEPYSRSGQLHTIRYLNALPIIRNASIKFAPVEGQDQLDALVFLSQRKRFAYTAEFNTVFRSTNYFGPGVIFSYTDRNRRQGAEMLKINLRASFEMQIVDGQVNPAYELGAGIQYTLPGLYPAFLFRAERKSLPRTTVSLGYDLFNRLDLYRLNSITTSLGYGWSNTDRIRHALNILELNFTQLPEESKSDEFKEYLEENPGVQRSFDEQFILGAGYEFTYDASAKGRGEFYFKGGVAFAGNLLNGIYTLANAEQDSLGRYLLLGVPFSQYVRLRTDVRDGFRVGRSGKVVGRLSLGLGIPFGNSDILPYIKQFYVGGTNSLRSFVARSVGPGSEVPPEGYNDVTGDIRLEANAEYRFTLSGSLKGAFFVDAGNIWLYNEDPARPDGHFRFDTFLKQVAISYGWGLRWDFDFLVARLDFAYTLRTPYLPEDERWSDGFNFWDPALSLAIGYPF
jgi:outer membrane protein assembly factor BamA